MDADSFAQVEDRLRTGVATRLSRYLQAATWAEQDGAAMISSHQIAEYTGVNSTQVRRDLSSFGKFGRRGFGYETDVLRKQLERLLGADDARTIVVVGAGGVGQSLVRSGLLGRHGLEIAAVFDSDPRKIGGSIGGMLISSSVGMAAQVKELGAVGAVIAVPPVAAQAVVDELVVAGVRAILNYSDATLNVPKDVSVQMLSPAVAFLSMLGS